MTLSDEKRKAETEDWLKKLEVIKKRRAKQTTPEYRAKRRKFNATPEQKARNKISSKKYHAKSEVKTKMNLAQKERRSNPEIREKLLKEGKSYRDNLRMKILQTYSKRLSNSEIPCCKCCGENSHLEFLAIDHIAGKKEMDSEPELVKLGYSSNFKSTSLNVWIVKNNFPKGFQILCHNCNQAKGYSKNNKCPHEKD